MLQLGAVIGDGVPVILSLQILGNKVHRAGAIQGNPRNNILQIFRFQLLHKRLHAAAFQLEDTLGLSRPDGIQDLLVIIINVVHIQMDAVVFLHLPDCVADHSKGPET